MINRRDALLYEAFINFIESECGIEFEELITYIQQNVKRDRPRRLIINDLVRSVSQSTLGVINNLFNWSTAEANGFYPRTRRLQSWVQANDAWIPFISSKYPVFIRNDTNVIEDREEMMNEVRKKNASFLFKFDRGRDVNVSALGLCE